MADATKTATIAQTPQLSRRERASYGAGAFGKDICFMLSSSWALYYFTTVMGMNPGAMGVILLVARIFDAFNDPLMGVVTAKTRTRWGKFRPWLFIGTLTNAVILFVMFACPPTLTGGALVAYAAVFYILWGLTYTMMDIPFWSMIPAFTRGGQERESLSTLGRSCSGIGQAVITIFAMKAVNLFDQSSTSGIPKHDGFRWVALIVALVFVLCEMITVFNIHEKSTVEVKTHSLKSMFQSLFKNDQALVVVFSIVLVNMAFCLATTLLPYLFQFDLFQENYDSKFLVYNAFGYIMQIFFMFVMFPLMRKKISNSKVFYLASTLGIVGFAFLFALPYLMKTPNVYVMFLPSFCNYVAQGLLNILTTVFLANTCDYGEWKTGSRDESVIFSMQTFVVKLGTGLAAFLASITQTICHIKKDNVGAEIILSNADKFGLRFAMSFLPIVILAVGILIFRRKFILTDEKIVEINEELEHRQEAGEEPAAE